MIIETPPPTTPDQDSIKRLKRFFQQHHKSDPKTLFQKTPACTLETFSLPQKTDILEMQILYKQNTVNSPRLVQQKLLKDFKKNTTDPNSKFFIFRHNSALKGFLCFSEIKPALPSKKNLFISGINLNKNYSGASIGFNMVQAALANESKKTVFFADVIPQNFFSSRLIESGFVGYRSWNDHGEPVLDIVRSKKIQNFFSTKAMTQKKLLSFVKSKRFPLSEEKYLFTSQNTTSIPFSLCNNGFILTRYFFNAQTSEWVVLFEKADIFLPKKSVL